MKALSISAICVSLGTVSSALVTDGAPIPEGVAAVARCVVKVHRGTGVYLGDRRIVTAAHVTLGLTTFCDESPIRFVAGSWRRIGSADLATFCLERPPAVPAVPIRLAVTSPKEGETVWLIGTGWRRGAPVVKVPNGKITGWKVIPTRQTLAGRAVVGFGAAMCPRLEIPSVCFCVWSGAQAVSGDSGGGAFVFRGGSWELVGIISHGYAPLTEEGGVSDIKRDTPSYMVDIATYRDQLLSTLGGRWAVR